MMMMMGRRSLSGEKTQEDGETERQVVVRDFVGLKKKKKWKKGAVSFDDVYKCLNVNYSAPWEDMVTLNARTVSSFGLKKKTRSATVF